MKTIQHKNIDKAVAVLSEEIAVKLQDAIRKNGKASLLVSGGKTPIPLFEALSMKNIAWKHVIIGLVDERMVSPDDDASNEKLVKTYLLQKHASEANFVGMLHDLNAKKNNLDRSLEAYKIFTQGIDVCILGMGADGHTASLFPQDEVSQNNLKGHQENILIYTTADVSPKERMTCTKFLIRTAKNLYLWIGGQQKLEVLQEAEKKEYPIAHFFTGVHTGLIVHYHEI